MYASAKYSVINENKPAKCDLHPTMKPINLVGTLIKNSSRKGELIMDPFGGSGSTLIASNQLGRKCYLMELSRIYVDVIVKRYLSDVGNIEDCHLIRDGKKYPLSDFEVFNETGEEYEN